MTLFYSKNKLKKCNLWGLFLCYLWLFTPSLVAEDVDKIAINTVLKRFPIKVSQGVAVDGTYIYGINNTSIVICNKETGKLMSTWEADKNKDAYKHFKHLNSATVIDGKLYGAHSRFPEDKNDNTVEIWAINGDQLAHEKTIHMPRDYGSITWIDKRTDNSWWVCYAVYGKDQNKNTKLVKYQFDKNQFTELKTWAFPEEARATWGNMSCSGGSWGPDGHLYVTGHDEAHVYVLSFKSDDKLTYLRTESDVGFYGQAIAWDRFSDRPLLWGIVRKQNISATLINTQ